MILSWQFDCPQDIILTLCKIQSKQLYLRLDVLWLKMSMAWSLLTVLVVFILFHHPSAHNIRLLLMKHTPATVTALCYHCDKWYSKSEMQYTFIKDIVQGFTKMQEWLIIPKSGNESVCLLKSMNEQNQHSWEVYLDVVCQQQTYFCC